MKKALRKLTSLITGRPAGQMPAAVGKRLTERQLIEKESVIGRELFGPIPHGHRREFFCLDEHTWVWHEEWKDEQTGKPRSFTTRYEIHDNGVSKIVGGHHHGFVEGTELDNLHDAIQIYYDRVMHRIYKRDPYTGQPLAE